VIGRINRVPLRKVWEHEAHDLTRWLEGNIDVLNEVTGLRLISAEREQRAGSFSVDLVARTSEGDTVIIENQLERSDHDHLGKLITYLVAIEAEAAIWIVSDPRPEHISAVAWLNQSSSASFYLLKVEAIQIGTSEPAPLLTLIVKPSVEGREVGEVKKEMAERDELRRDFWTTLLQRAKSKTKLHAAISPGTVGWISAGSGIGGIGYVYTASLHDGGIELYIDKGKDAEGENKRIFDALLACKEEVERQFGDALEWQRLDGKQACRVRKRYTICGYGDDRSRWPEVQDTMIDSMVRFEKAFGPHLSRLKKSAG
jgi:Domain of unknown function (DUF4268)